MTSQQKSEQEPLADLAARIAHDVGTPMTAILGYAELIEKSIGDDKNRKRARNIIDQAHRVNQLLQELLRTSQADR